MLSQKTAASCCGNKVEWLEVVKTKTKTLCAKKTKNIKLKEVCTAEERLQYWVISQLM